MLMTAATVVQQLCKSCRSCFVFYCMFYFTCDRYLRLFNLHGRVDDGERRQRGTKAPSDGDGVGPR